MRIGLVIYGALDTVSGGYLYDRVLVQYLRQQGETVEIVSLPWRSYGRHLADNLSAQLWRRLNGAPPFDVLLQDELNHPSLFWLNRRLRRQAEYSQPASSYPIISIVHHLRCSEARPAWQNSLYRQVERRYLATVDGFIYNSQTSRGVVEGLVGAGRPGVVAYPGGDRLPSSLTRAQLRQRASDPGPLRLLFIGNLIPRKGLHTLVQALARLPRAGGAVWRLTVVGSAAVDPAYAREVQRQVRQSGLERQITFTGAVTDDELARHMAASHLLVGPSSYEGFGIVYLEGMGFGLPAIASTAGAAAEFVAPGENGFLVAPEDSAALAEQIQKLAHDRQLLLQLSLAALETFAAHPTWEKTAQRIHAFLREFQRP